MPEHGPCARRVIDLQSSGNSVVAWLEDDFHHFGIEMHHDGSKVTGIEGQAARFPRDTCPGALGVLEKIVGMPLDKRSAALGEYTNMRMQCTHLYDLAGLAIAHAACGRDHRRYEAMVPDRELVDFAPRDSLVRGTTRPELFRDGERIMNWEVDGDIITGPEKYTGTSLGRGFRAWTETLTVDEAEAAHVLRRATMVALGRMVDLQALSADAVKWTEGVCYSFQPEVALHSSRTEGMTRDFSDQAQGPLAKLRKR
jgi:hypothetical protein